MSSQPLAFGELLAGGVLLAMGLTGGNVRDVIAGRATSIGPIAGTSGVAFKSSGPGGATGLGQLPPGTDPALTKRAARALKGIGKFDGVPVALWIIPYLSWARAHGWTGHVTSGYRSEAEQAQIYNSGIRPAAKPGTSNHEGKAFPRGAVDVTEAAQLAHVLSQLPGALLKWAGSADPVHFSFPHGGGY